MLTFGDRKLHGQGHMQNFPSPRLNAYLALLKDFQRALLPKPSSLIRSINQAPAADPHCFQFALGTSSHETLSRAVVECVQQIKHKLGQRNPDLCQLFITADTYGSNNIRFASAVSLATPFHLISCFERRAKSSEHNSLLGLVHTEMSQGYLIGLHVSFLDASTATRLPGHCVVRQYVQECLSGSNNAPPVVLGGAVQVIQESFLAPVLPL